MSESETPVRDLSALAVPQVGKLVKTGDVWEPYRLVDASGAVVEPVAEYFRDLLGCGRSESTLYAYGNGLLRWWRFLAAVEVGWDRATRVEARDFVRWLQHADKPQVGRMRKQSGEAVNAVTGKPKPGRKYQASTRAHTETVLRKFYDFHQESCTGPVINPFPLVRDRRTRRANAHHNPMAPFRNERQGRYRPKIPKRIPRMIPDSEFNDIFAALGSNRDRALVAFWVSTGARASELLGARFCDADPGQQLISVVRKGTRAVQPLPASPDAFVWLRLYQAQLRGQLPKGRSQPLWWTLRRPLRPLTYHAAHRMFERVNANLGSNWTLHDLRHTAAYRMSRDPKIPLVDVQWVMGHASLTTTQLYMTPTGDEVIENVLAHHARQETNAAARQAPPPAPGYSAASLNVLFGRVAP
ncbi:tyrosine-type recombinase/integrase [Streptomyces sp. NPDC018019]|uniref:tyrosine-type recombinase/integrase n=1 Tax=Streptomyces sp. NPDC018019 TaxID=3365030 RepID=UPI0037AD9413